MKHAKSSGKKTLGQSIDELYILDKEIKRQQQALKLLTSKRFTLETQMLEDFDKKDIRGASGKQGKASLTSRAHPTIKDRKKFWAYLLKHKAYDLVQNRIAPKAYFDRVEEGEQIGGVEIFTSYKVSVTKQKRKV